MTKKKKIELTIQDKVVKGLFQKDKEHSCFSPSSAGIWTKCPGSLIIGLMVPDLPSNPDADKGILAHSFIEYGARQIILKGRTLDWVMNKINLKCKDEEMALHVKTCLTLYLSLIRKFPPMKLFNKDNTTRELIFIEEMLDFDARNGAYGTTDLSYIHCIPNSGGKLVGVSFDYKNGRGLVEAEGNCQLALYGLSLKRHTRQVLDRLTVFVYQPNGVDDSNRPHPDGPFRKWTLDKQEMEKYETMFQGVINRVKKLAEDPENLPESSLVPGDHCRWCKANAICPKLAANLPAVPEVLNNQPFKNINLLTDAQIQRLINHIPKLRSYIKRLEGYCIARSNANNPVPGIKIVEGRSSRKWRDDMSHEEIGKELMKMGCLDPYNRTLKGLTMIEKEIGKNRIGDLTVKPAGKPTLVLESDPRPEYSVNADTGFEYLVEK